MLIGGDDISNDAITLGTRFSMFVNICPRFHVALICENSIAQSTGSPREIGGGIQIPQMLLQAFLPSFAPPSELSRELDYSTNSGTSTSQLRLGIQNATHCISKFCETLSRCKILHKIIPLYLNLSHPYRQNKK